MVVAALIVAQEVLKRKTVVRSFHLLYPDGIASGAGFYIPSYHCCSFDNDVSMLVFTFLAPYVFDVYTSTHIIYSILDA